MSPRFRHIRILSLLLAVIFLGAHFNYCGWTMGTLVSALGVILSVKIDTPTGAAIVVTFGGVLMLMFLLHLILHHGRDARYLEGATSARHKV